MIAAVVPLRGTGKESVMINRPSHIVLLPLAIAMAGCPGYLYQPTTQPGASHADAAAESAASRATLNTATAGRASFAAATSSACGGLDQRPCFVWERIPSCNAGLVENILGHRCTSAGPGGALESSARAVATDLRDLLAALGGYVTCFDASLIRGALDRGDTAYADELKRSSCVKRMGAMAHERGYRTLTIGISGGGSFIVGASIDTGFAFDTAGKTAPTLYQTKAISIGFQAGGGVAINIGLSKGSNAVNTAGSDSHGFSFEAGAGAGAGVAIWYDYDGNLDGVSVSAIAGAEGEAGAYNRVNTSYYDLAGNNPVVCGANGRRACKLWERIPSCDAGLVEDLAAGMCRTEKQFPCGAANQRACKLWERIPSCNAGLYEDLLAATCKKPAPAKPLACGAKNQRPCKLWERIPSCNKGLVEDFFAGKCR
jgi:hypothetical protein